MRVLRKHTAHVLTCRRTLTRAPTRAREVDARICEVARTCDDALQYFDALGSSSLLEQ